jgi:RNA-binding protein
MKDIIKLRAKALGPLLRIGKNGLTEGSINEIKLMLKKRGLIKIKLLRSFTEGKDKKESAKEIAEKTDSILVESLGNIVVLSK